MLIGKIFGARTMSRHVAVDVSIADYFGSKSLCCEQFMVRNFSYDTLKTL